MKTELSSDKLIPFLSEKFKTELKFNPKSVIERKEVFINKVQSVNDEDGTCECIISTEEPDRVGDVVVSAGIDTSEFKKIPSVYVNHNYAALPVAVCESMVHKNKEIVAKIKFVTAIPAVKNIFELVKAGALRGISVGFEAQEMLQKGTKEFDTYVKDMMMDSAILSKVRRIFKTWKLYEFSVCSVPANSNCYIKSLVDAKQEVSPDLAKILGYEDDKGSEEVKEETKSETIVTKTVTEETTVGDVKEVKTETTVEVKRDIDAIVEEILKADIEVESVEIEVEDEPEVIVTKEAPKYFHIVRTPEDVDEYIKKAVEAKLSGRLNIQW